MTGTWLLDLTIGGRVLRYATTRSTITDADGASYLYRAGLADFEMRLDGQQEAQGFQLVDPSINWGELAAKGENLDRATCTLRYWDGASVLERALVALDGICTSPEYADPDQPRGTFVGTVKADAADRLWPDPRAVVSSTTWQHVAAPVGPTYDDIIAGAVYPTIFGFPGEEDDGTVSAGTYALLVKTDGAILNSRLMVCDGEAPGLGREVTIFQPDEQDSNGWSAYESLVTDVADDLLGRTVTVVLFSAGAPAAAGSAGSVVPETGTKFYCGWKRDAALPGHDRDLTDIALFCLKNSGRRFDMQAQEAQRGALQNYHVDGAINAPDLALVPWFESNIATLFPVIRARTRNGIYWRHVKWNAGPTDIVAHLNADARQVARTSSIRSFDDQVRNHLVIEYARDASNGRYRARRTLTAEAEAVLPWWQTTGQLADARVVGSPICAMSQSVYGLREGEPIQSPFVWSSAEATGILEHLATRDAFPRRTVSYSGPPRELAGLQAGDAVMVTDTQDDASLHGEIGIVTAVRLSSRRLVEVDLHLIDRRVRG